ncbi:MAG: bifunctional DNA-formamidopyrimidine glycosylase/DNA-(apurinic or apyrimidinic site) lyase [Symbiobacteriaceae bacterium]|nr:bifunctional DNA-formamidopyrimidine glycosylase/DNA-(apurinic or apyrimidinic site) lyase [Symbiobacteriaceae bacterium]
MPELPEVETICRALQERVAGEQVAEVTVLHPKVVQPRTPEDFAGKVTGCLLSQIKRRGKYLLLELERQGERAGLLVVHLRMTGQLHWVTAKDTPLMPHTHVLLHMASGKQLRYVDTRRFGKVRYQEDIAEDPTLVALGPEPFDPLYTGEELWRRCQRHSGAIKGVLLRQDIIAGLGNIYADEALFLAGIHPKRSARDLTEDEAVNLLHHIRVVLEESINYKGSSMRDYCNIDGVKGSYQEHWRVYGQKGKPCPLCGTPLERITVQGRGSHFCPVCQR